MRGSVALPYVRGLSEKIRRTLTSHKINSYFVPQNKLRSHLVHPKDKIKPEDTSGVVYGVPCMNCNLIYIGETGRKLGNRIKEHKKDVEDHMKGVITRSSRMSQSNITHKSAITDHAIKENHTPNWEAKVLKKEGNINKRGWQEAIIIAGINGNNMNRDQGGMWLPHIYDDLLEVRRPAGADPSGIHPEVFKK
ncbi:uncharacterized protein [Antedon mediterranea]|uniref:uncharacterized protein n=1 Tax=Antedon mediterranea TaxID=105859 RepID=UPI003AF8F9F2